MSWGAYFIPAGKFEKANEPTDLTLSNHFLRGSVSLAVTDHKALENFRAISPVSCGIGYRLSVDRGA